MTYNGVGVRTPRGTGTSGYIQRNAGALPTGGGRSALLWKTESYFKPDIIQKEKHKDIRDHERKRRVEVRLLEAREAMEEDGVPEDKIEQKLQSLRKRFTQDEEDRQGREDARPKKSLADYAAAFGISPDYKEGDAFDQELQEQRKADAKQRREAEQSELLEEQLLREIAEEEQKLRQRKEEKALAKEAKHNAKEEKKERKKQKKRLKKEAKKRKKKEKKARKREQEGSSSSSDSSSSSSSDSSEEEEAPRKKRRKDKRE